jgi:hypothetical protein
MAGVSLDYPRYTNNVTFKKLARIKATGYASGELFD